MPYKNPKFDVKLKYRRMLEIGIILAVSIVIAAFRFFPEIDINYYVFEEQEPFVVLDDVMPTDVDEVPPAPPKPPIPVEAPEDEILEDIPIDDTEIDLYADLEPPDSPIEENDDSELERIFIAVENMPEIIGGLAKLQSRVIYPQMAIRAGIQGKVHINAVVGKDGIVDSARISKGIGFGCDEAAIKAVLSTKFKPGMQRGKPVKVQLGIPISFKLK